MAVTIEMRPADEEENEAISRLGEGIIAMLKMVTTPDVAVSALIYCLARIIWSQAGDAVALEKMIESSTDALKITLAEAQKRQQGAGDKPS